MDAYESNGVVSGGTGLAMTVGELKAKIARLNEELTRTESDLRDADSRDKGELDDVDRDQQDAIENLIVRVEAIEAELDIEELEEGDDASEKPVELVPETPEDLGIEPPAKLRGAAKLRAQRQDRRQRR